MVSLELVPDLTIKAVGCLLLILLACIFFTGKKKGHVPSTVHFTKSENSIHGIIFGKKKKKYAYSPIEEEGHVIVWGGSGTGKTSSILIPTINTLGKDATGFVIDISGDIYKNCKGIPDAIRFEITDPDSVPYNIFGSVDKFKEKCEADEELERLAILLMPESPMMSDTSRFYQMNGRKILTASLLAFYHQGYDFTEICKKITDQNYGNLFREIDAAGYMPAITMLNSFEGANEQNTAGCKQAADSAVSLFARNHHVLQSVRRPMEGETCLTPETLETNSVFAIINDSDLELYAPLVHMMIAQIFDYIGKRDVSRINPIVIALDEFASFGKLEVTSALRKFRKKHCRIMVLTQSMADIDMIYGKAERMSMLNNFKYKVVLGASDTDTQVYLSNLIGQDTVLRKSTTKSAKSFSTTNAEVRDWAVEPADLDRLGDDLILIYPGSYVRLSKNYYFKKQK